eukprot:jgi/Psemu1/284536/fgenesh1_pg.56_\
MSSFPRISISGTVILAVYVFVQARLFNKSVYGASLKSGAMYSASSVTLNSLTCASSLLNVTSHALVVLGALNDTYVISILVGVGFDVVTRILQLIWWMHLSRISFAFLKADLQSIGFVVLLSVIYIYHMLIHVRALRMNSSGERLRSVLTGALNNLRGIAGEGFRDHIFAYSDLGSHAMPTILSAVLLHQQQAMLTAIQIILAMIVLSVVALSRIPFNAQKDQDGVRSLVQVSSNGSVFCSCDACVCRSRRTNEKCSFTFQCSDGICYLWLCSFETLSSILCSLENGKAN